MIYLVLPGAPLRLGAEYREGEFVDLIGRTTHAVFGDRLLEIVDPELLSLLRLRAKPFVIVQPLRRARVDYRPREAATGGEWLLWLGFRSEAQAWGDAIRPATASEVLEWVRARQAKVAAGRKLNLAVRNFDTV